MNKRQIGTKYEELAAAYLQEHGYRILGCNVRCRHGELDIVAAGPDGTLTAVEVKYRSSDAYGDALEAVGIKKQKTISSCMQEYLVRHGLTGRACRFDVIAVYGDGSLCHVADAFPFRG